MPLSRAAKEILSYEKHCADFIGTQRYVWKSFQHNNSVCSPRSVAKSFLISVFFLLLLRIFARNKESIANIMNMPKFLRKTLFYPFTFLKLRKKLFYVLFMASYNNFHFASDNILSLIISCFVSFVWLFAEVDDPAIKVVGNVIYCWWS